MRMFAILLLATLSACSSNGRQDDQKNFDCPQPRAMNDHPQRNSIVLQRQNLIPVHVAYVQLPAIDAGAVLMIGGGAQVLYRGVPPDNRAQVAQMEPSLLPQPVAAAPLAAIPPIAPHPAHSARKPKASYAKAHPARKPLPMCSCPDDELNKGSEPSVKRAPLKGKESAQAAAQTSATSEESNKIMATAPPAGPAPQQMERSPAP